MKIDREFRVQPLSWYKRRVPTEIVPKVVDFDISGFEKIDNSYCDVYVKFDNGDNFNLEGRITSSITYTVGGDQVIHGWSVQALGPNGLSVLFRLVEGRGT